MIECELQRHFTVYVIIIVLLMEFIVNRELSLPKVAILVIKLVNLMAKTIFIYIFIIVIFILDLVFNILTIFTSMENYPNYMIKFPTI